MAEKVKHSKDSPASVGKGIGSIVGLVALAAAVYFGLPHLSSSLKSITDGFAAEEKEVTSTDNKKSKEEETAPVSDAKDTPVVASSKVEPKKKLSQTKLNQALVEKSVDDAIQSALRKQFRTDTYQFTSAIVGQSGESVMAIFELNGDSFEFQFNYVEEYKMFKAKLGVGQESFFTRGPSFSLVR